MMERFAVITADIIDSRRQEVGLTLLRSQLKQIRSRALLTDFNVSRGDELQAVCRDLAELPVLIRHLRYRCLPMKLRVGVGIGVIDPETLMFENSWEMNGEAFFMARKALNQIEIGQNKTPATLFVSAQRDFDRTVNAIYRLYDLVLNKWTAKQWETVHAYESNVTLMKTAAMFNVSWQNIQKICKAANWETVSQTETDLAYLLKKQFE